jgi:MoaA/NifB/PqqE/SkfB family radical SAM enzyme
MRSLLSKFSLKENKRRYLNIKGIISRRYAYKAPDVVQIDLTDRCNSHCLACWTHSPFLKRNGVSAASDLDVSVLKVFIEDIAGWGTREIIISGGGEPFLYPHIWDVLEFIKKTGLCFRLNTNLTLLGKDDIRRLASFDNLASITISAWSGEALLYSKLHGRDTDVFDKVKNNLRFLNARKLRVIDTTLYAIITNLNYADVRNLLVLAIETKCDAIEFGVLDTIPGVTDFLLLNSDQLRCLREYLMDALKYIKKRKGVIRVANKDIFLRRISGQKANRGEYDSHMDRMPCYAGWTFLRVRANGDFNSCLKSHRIPAGNLYKDSIFSVWNNTLQQKFRERSLNTPKDKAYFRVFGNADNQDTGCSRMCDNILINESMYRLLRHVQKNNI